MVAMRDYMEVVMKLLTLFVLSFAYVSCASEKYTHKKPDSSVKKSHYAGAPMELWERHHLRLDRR